MLGNFVLKKGKSVAKLRLKAKIQINNLTFYLRTLGDEQTKR